MNAINRYELFVLEDGEKPVEIIEDTKIPNAVTIKIFKQDHTLASMVRSELLATPCVLFAGYKVPHPLEPAFVLKIQTDGSQPPVQVLENVCTSLIATFSKLADQFKREFSARELDIQVEEDPYGPVGTNSTSGAGVWGAGNRRDYLDF
ncbi:RBP11-like subunits of RNA polymerase [Sistotremastrum niveocremeum HHB9708]|uniref:RBP11-like subunits of RNA polymerase n=2 Tax=Sistotremastraceae TaxID=3402574 RepID=A0A164XT14_9AGAM|nr:RBP11-like subunits of RNA polymerase [Sistotremastrum niveocremeum HHB9708]KZT34762.1 RBP11-like subunits of RNA polymerase [Sistotremastrum suecicum HHB10207 ss-3]